VPFLPERCAVTVPLLTLDHVDVRLGSFSALSNVSLQVDDGKVVTVVGPNGAGKSTLVKTALGLLRPCSGKVRRRPGAVIGYVPQKLHLPATLPLSVGRFLTMAAPKADAAVLAAALDRVGARHALDRQAMDLSGGELQRVLLARALLRDPALLVLDEPVGGVDMAGQAEIYDLIAKLARDERRGVLMVSHDLHVVMAATDEVVCLNRHVCCAGHPESVTRHPEYLALFGPRVAASLAVYTHMHDHAHLPDGTIAQGQVPQPHIHGPDCRHG
jgi:zinc transport system ATP-binding protein